MDRLQMALYKVPSIRYKIPSLINLTMTWLKTRRQSHDNQTMDGLRAHRNQSRAGYPCCAGTRTWRHPENHHSTRTPHTCDCHEPAGADPVRGRQDLRKPADLQP